MTSSLFSGQSGTVQTPGQSSYVTYYNGSTYAGPSGSDSSFPSGAQIANNGIARGGQVVNLASDTIPSIADLAAEIGRLTAGNNQDLGSPPTGPAFVIRDIAAVTSGTFTEAFRGLYTGTSISKAPPVEETAPSVVGQAQSAPIPSDTSSEGTAPIVEARLSPGPGVENVASPSTGPGDQGSGNGWLWMILVGLVLGTGALAGLRSLLSGNQDESNLLDSGAVFFEYANPPSAEQQERELNLVAAKAIYEQETQISQQRIQDDSQRSQQAAQEAQQDTEALAQVTQTLQENTEKLQQEKAILRSIGDSIQQDQAQEEQINEEGKQLDEEMLQLEQEYASSTYPLSLQDYEAQQSEIDQLSAEGFAMDQQVQSLEQNIEELRGEGQSVEGQMSSLEQDVGTEQLGISQLQNDIQYNQDVQMNSAADIAQQQANQDAAANQYQLAEQQAGPQDPNQGWDTSTDPLSPAPANPGQSEPQPDPGGNQDTQDSKASPQPEPTEPSSAPPPPTWSDSYSQGYKDGVAWASDPNNRGQTPPLVFNPDYLNGFQAGVADLRGNSSEAAFFFGTVLAIWGALAGAGAAVAEGVAGAEQIGWQLGSNHSPEKWANQMEKRGWTPEQIDEALAKGESFPATNYVNPENPATRYVNPETGRSVVIDDQTKEILHVGGDNFKY
ncbi:MAG: colicin E5-related ribonuclease [Desulfomonilaceae bacterium]